MKGLHGTKHPFEVGDAIVPGTIGGCACIDLEQPDCARPESHDLAVWATNSLEAAFHWAQVRMCCCEDPESEDHRPRVFEVELYRAQADRNMPGEASSLEAKSASVVAEIQLPPG